MQGKVICGPWGAYGIVGDVVIAHGDPEGRVYPASIREILQLFQNGNFVEGEGWVPLPYEIIEEPSESFARLSFPMSPKWATCYNEKVAKTQGGRSYGSSSKVIVRIFNGIVEVNEI